MHSLDLIFQVTASKQRLLVPETIFNTSLDAFLITEQIVTIFLNKTPWWLLFGAWGTSLYGADQQIQGVGLVNALFIFVIGASSPYL